MNVRSYLYVPANDLERLIKALGRGADALVVDLEDGVSPADKDVARSNLGLWLETLDTDIEIWVRVNSEEGLLEKDLDVAASSKLTGIVLAKCESHEEILNLDKKLTALESTRGIGKKIEVFPLIESATGVFNLLEIAKSPRVSRLQIGDFDLRADLGISVDAGDTTLQYARRIAGFASAAAGIKPPVAAVSINFRDLDAYRFNTQHFKRWGYFGRACIHPGQVEIANEVFKPTADELSKAQEILDRLVAAGGGVALDAQGRMIDEAIAKIARRMLNMGK